MRQARLGLATKLRRLIPGGWRPQGATKNPSDANFIGFDKYKRFGAYHWSELGTNPHYRAKIQLLEQLVNKTDLCLDLGCGDGAYVYVLSKGCAEIIGVDADTHAASLANRQLESEKVGNARCLHLTLSQVNPESVGKGSFDLVYSMDVIEHLPEPGQLLEVSCKMVKPGGLVAIGTPLYLGDHLVSEYHVKEFSRDEFVELLSHYIDLERVEILPDKRLDGKMYDEAFIVGIGTPRVA